MCVPLVAADLVDGVGADPDDVEWVGSRPRPPLVKHTRWALLKAPDHHSLDQLGTLREVYQRSQRVYRAFLLYQQLRLLYALENHALAPAHLDA